MAIKTEKVVAIAGWHDWYKWWSWWYWRYSMGRNLNKVDMGTMVHRMDIDNLRKYKL